MQIEDRQDQDPPEAPRQQPARKQFCKRPSEQYGCDPDGTKHAETLLVKILKKIGAAHERHEKAEKVKVLSNLDTGSELSQLVPIYLSEETRVGLIFKGIIDALNIISTIGGGLFRLFLVDRRRNRVSSYRSNGLLHVGDGDSSDDPCSGSPAAGEQSHILCV
jgi:hypothetical protein